MKARYEHIQPRQAGRSIASYRIAPPAFEFDWHYHPELELTWIIAGRGSRLVGDHVESFEEDDLVLLGANLPHTWQSDRGVARCEAVVVQFPEAVFRSGLHQLAEMEALNRLLDDAVHGLHFEPPCTHHLKPILTRLVETTGAGRIARLIDALVGLMAHPSRRLASPGYQPMLDQRAKDRLDTVCRYLASSYTRPVTLAEVATLAHMSEAAFSRYFRRMTGTTFTQYVIGLRVDHACHLLHASDEPIAAIAFAAGFGSLANFNRRFRERKGLTPRRYRQRFR